MTILATILATTIMGLAKTILSVDKSMNEIGNKVKDIEKAIEEIDTEKANKDLMDVQLDYIKDEISKIDRILEDRYRTQDM